MFTQLPLVNRLQELDFSPLFSVEVEGHEVPFSVTAAVKASFWKKEQLFPAYFAILSAFLLILHTIVLSRPVQKLWTRLRGYEGVERKEEEDLPDNSPASLWQVVKRHVQTHGGWHKINFMLARLVSVLVLLALSIVTLVLEETGNTDGPSTETMSKRKKHKHRKSGKFNKQEWIDAIACAFYLYCSLLALISVVSSSRRVSKIAKRHLNTILFVAWVVYVYRDLYPLATFTKTPKDLVEGPLLWAKVSILTFVAAVIPLTIPRQYTPIDRRNPFPVPSPDQTSSILSMALHSFLDKTVWEAYRVPHLPYESLPPLADTDEASHLRKRAFQNLDVFSGAKKGRHLFFGLMKTFRLEYIVMSLMLVLQVAGSFASPVGIYQLLDYLESGGANATVRPWVWISWLFLGPLLCSITMQWYIFTTTRMLVRTEAILTELVFEHSLRIRVKATADSKDSTPKSSTVNSAASTRPSSPEDGGHGSEEGSGSESTADASTLHPTSEATEDTLRAPSSSTKKDSKDSDTTQPSSSDSSNLVGKINNLVSTDLGNIIDGRDFLFLILYTPLQIILCIWFLYSILDWAAFVGLAAILLLLPAPGLVARVVQKVQEKRLVKTDARVQYVTETMNVLRMVKLFGWEKKMNERIGEKRNEELTWIGWKMLMDLLNGTLNFVIPIITMIATYTAYTVVMKQQLSASKVFSSMTVFDLLRDQLHMAFGTISQVVTGKVSLSRLNDFLQNTELLDRYTDDNKESIPSLIPAEEDHFHSTSTIGFHRASFAWSNDASHDGWLTPSKRKFRLHIEDELTFALGKVNLVVGPTGSGKTSLLMALLGEMHYIAGGPDSWYNLPRSGGVAYAAQESWVQNETIRENILFGSEFDEERYKKVLHQCGLERDITLFEAGDKTEVGEKGLTLSGGQKARITLARAVYSRANILLLDDVLAALDVHTSKWIVDKCFKGDLMKDRTVILVTHNVALASETATFAVSIHNGRVHTQGSPSEIFAQDHAIAKEVEKEQQILEKTDEQTDDNKPPADPDAAEGKLIVAEEVAEGHISWAAMKLYLNGLTGSHPLLFFTIWLGGMTTALLLETIETWWLGHWGAQYQLHPGEDIPVAPYITVYVVLLSIGVFTYTCGYIAYVRGAMRASASIHERLVQSVLGTTLRWLDTTPTSRVITRCTQDMRAIDGPVATLLVALVEFSIIMLIKLISVIVITPVFMIPGLLVAALGGMCGQIYIKAQLSVKREMSNAKAPVIGHFGAAIAGLTSIRAYGAEERFKGQSISRINKYTRAARTFFNLNRWICIRIDALGGLFAASLAAYLVYGHTKAAETTGFSLNMAVGFSGMILWWVRILNEFEVQGNSLERVEHYVNIEQEPKSTDRGEPPAYWPASGKIQVENLTARYSQDGPKVLHDLSFTINSGERVGVVGRTGSGKSSLTLALLRCIVTGGEVYYDGMPTSKLNLDALRSNITIIPQVPELLSGTLRQNLDPFDQYDDAQLNAALRAAGLFALQDIEDEGRITLDSTISSGGGNLSVGQRQILALARAIVRGSKLLILDEATSAIDYKTDAIIQSSLRQELGNDVTLLTVAHRLQTIMDADKIMVLDAGNIVEFDSPQNLLQISNGRLKSLVDESADKDILYAMAEGK